MGFTDDELELLEQEVSVFLDMSYGERIEYIADLLGFWDPDVRAAAVASWLAEQAE